MNTVGPGDTGTIDTLSDEGWARSLELGLMSAVRCTRAALPWLRKARVGAHRERLGALDAAPDADADRLHRREVRAHEHEQEPREDARARRTSS